MDARRRARLIGSAIAFLILALYLAFPEVRTYLPLETGDSASSIPLPATSHRAQRVIDGDTIVLDTNGSETRVRLIGVDTPESVDPRRPVECFGTEAAEKTRALVEGKTVTLELDESQGERDRYGRVLAYVRLEDGTLLNERLIAEGYGHEYTFAIPYRYQSQFKAAEARARSEKKGLWADGACGA